MLALTEYSPECRIKQCKYNLQAHCGLNVKTDNDVIENRCLPSDNWYITGSFVLDRVFCKTTANDIDLVAHQREMPARLPDEVLESPLTIEMLWLPEEDERNCQCYNINLPRITSRGMINQEAARAIGRERIISVLPGRKKLDMLSICAAIKAIVKYGMKLDQRTIKIWSKSIESPLKLKKIRAFTFWTEVRGPVNWDYLGAKYLIERIGLAYISLTDNQRRQYLQKLSQTLVTMPLIGNITYDCLMEWLNVVIGGDDKKKREIEKCIHDQGFKLRKQ